MCLLAVEDRYVKCLYVYNKVDMISIEDMDKLAREPNSIVVSVHMKLNLSGLLVRETGLYFLFMFCRHE